GLVVCPRPSFPLSTGSAPPLPPARVLGVVYCCGKGEGVGHMARTFSGIQPTGDIHIGNYLGALRNWVQLQDHHECIFAIVDLHAMTIPYDARAMPREVLDKAATLIACGIDPQRSVLYVQSHVREHTELCWIL